MSMDYLGERVRFVRQQRSLTTTELGELVGVSQGHISKIENGERQPTPALIRELARELGVRESWLLEGSGLMYEAEPQLLSDKEAAGQYVDEIARALDVLLEPTERDSLISYILPALQKIRGDLSKRIKDRFQQELSRIPETSQTIVGTNIISGNFQSQGDVVVGGNKIVTQRHTTRTINTPPSGSISEAQAREVHERLVRIGGLESSYMGSSAYGAVMNQFKKRYGITSYKNLPSTQYGEALTYLEKREKVLEKRAMSEGKHPLDRQEYIRRIQTISRVELKWTDPIRREKMLTRYGKTSLSDFNMTELEDFYKYVSGLKSKQASKKKSSKK